MNELISSKDQNLHITSGFEYLGLVYNREAVSLHLLYDVRKRELLVIEVRREDLIVDLRRNSRSKEDALLQLLLYVHLLNDVKVLLEVVVPDDDVFLGDSADVVNNSSDVRVL